MLVLFDLDGTLIDSADVIKECYRIAGANPPDNIFEHEGHAWLREQFYHHTKHITRVHTHKNREYIRWHQENEAKYLPPYDVAQYLSNHHHKIGVLTGAPHGTCITLLQHHYDMWKSFTYLRDGLRTNNKIQQMKLITRLEPKIGKFIYIDDQPLKTRLPREWSFIQYTGQDPDTLLEMIQKI